MNTRHRHRQWDNRGDARRGFKTYVPWTCRITWFGSGENASENIRLKLEDRERSVNLYPKSKETAEHIWFMFRNQAAPLPGDDTPCVKPLLDLLRETYPDVIKEQAK